MRKRRLSFRWINVWNLFGLGGLKHIQAGQPFGQSGLIFTLLQSLRAIIAQNKASDTGQRAGDGQQTVTPPTGRIARPRSILPLTTRLGFFGAVAILMWWSWPASQTGAAWPNGQAVISTPTVTANALAILNPANLPAVQARPTSAIVLPSIVTLPDAAAVLTETVSVTALMPIEQAATNANALGVLSDPPLGAEVVSDDVVELVLLPTATATEEPAAAFADLPQVRILPAEGFALPTLPPPTATPAPRLLPTPVAARVKPGRLWSTFTPPTTGNDHFWVGRSFAPSVANQLGAPSYQFGSTGGNNYRPHHGVDIANPFGTPVLAAAEGEVVHAGLDDPILIGPYNNFYGNTVVIRLNKRLPVAAGKLDVYLLYGHLSQTSVTVGQRVQPQDVVGLVGMSGIAIGPHLHVEMRLGANTYQHSVNPYLWVQPVEGTGAVAVLLLTAEGRTIPGARLTLARFEGNAAVWGRLIETYLDTENISPDPAWGENGAMDGAPAGEYYLVGVVNGESIRSELTVRAGETTFVEIRTRQ